MERIIAREYLQEIRAMNIAIHNRQRQLAQLDYTLELSGISYSSDRIQNSPRKDSLERKAIEHLEKRERLRLDIQGAINQLLDRQNEAVTYINQIRSEKQKEILMLRYIELRSWSDILDMKGVDDISGMYKLRNRAIYSLQKILDNEKNKK